jgi:hypothetical protein
MNSCFRIVVSRAARSRVTRGCTSEAVGIARSAGFAAVKRSFMRFGSGSTGILRVRGDVRACARVQAASTRKSHEPLFAWWRFTGWVIDRISVHGGILGSAGGRMVARGGMLGRANGRMVACGDIRRCANERMVARGDIYGCADGRMVAFGDIYGCANGRMAACWCIGGKTLSRTSGVSVRRIKVLQRVAVCG